MLSRVELGVELFTTIPLPSGRPCLRGSISVTQPKSSAFYRPLVEVGCLDIWDGTE